MCSGSGGCGSGSGGCGTVSFDFTGDSGSSEASPSGLQQKAHYGISAMQALNVSPH